MSSLAEVTRDRTEPDSAARSSPGRRGGSRTATRHALSGADREPRNTRVLATRVLIAVLHRGVSLPEALAATVPVDLAPPDRALIQELCYGVLRWEPRLGVVVGELLHKPLKKKHADLHCLILIGLYQLAHQRTPAHAAVAEAVQASRALGKPWATRLVNAALRSFQRGRANHERKLAGDPVAELAHPSWLLEQIRASWPQHWREILAANNQRPPLTLRVNARRVAPARYRQRLHDSGIESSAVADVPAALVLRQPVDVGRLPGFATGEVSVQDAGAQLAAPLLRLQPGQRVLDACAAPGGKTCHIAELEPRLRQLVALDKDPRRAALLRENRARLDVAAEILVGDATRPEDWWDGVPFDRVLLDAPCSASGVIRRHPDVKHLRRPGDLSALAASQQALLQALWPLLRVGGILLYATCSVLARENSELVARFLALQPDARACPVAPSWGRRFGHGRQILPGDRGMDGFYYAVLVKHDR